MGVEFDVYPCADLPDVWHDIGYAVDSIDDCIEDCLIHQHHPPGQYGPCVAVTYRLADSFCFQKNASINSSADLFSSSIVTSALGDQSKIRPSDSQCQYANASIQTVRNGLEFEVFCNCDIGGYDMMSWVPVNGSMYYHADTLEECMTYCSELTPKCSGVSFNPTLSYGYHNCYTKNSGIESVSLACSGTTTRSHSARARFAVANTTCANDTNYFAPQDRTFHMTCDQALTGEDIVKKYVGNFGACIDECARYQPDSNTVGECKAVMYQPDGANGYENCYLKAVASRNATVLPGWRSAIVVDENPVAPPDPVATKKGSAWIAGPAVGSAAALLFCIALGWWLWRRRRTSSAPHKLAWQSGGTETSVVKGSQLGLSNVDNATAWQSQGNPKTQESLLGLSTAASGRNLSSELDGSSTERKELDRAHAVTSELPADFPHRVRI
jgi:hypothetical protein